MSNRYNGSYEMETNDKNHGFDWSTLVFWIGSLLLSLVPMYIELIKYYNVNQEIDVEFWTHYFTKGDILWVFSTLLLFVLVDSKSKRRKEEKKWVKIVFNVGIVLFAISEATFILFNTIVEPAIWPLYIGIPIVITTLAISTPLKIEFIKED